MAKPITQKIKLLSTAGTGFFYVTKKNPRTATDKLSLQEVRSRCAQARRLQGNEDQVGALADRPFLAPVDPTAADVRSRAAPLAEPRRCIASRQRSMHGR